MRSLWLTFLMLAASGLTLRADEGTHEWVANGPGGLYGLIQYDWVHSTTDGRVWPKAEVTWPISPATHKIRSYTLIHFAGRRFSVPFSAPATVCLIVIGVAVVTVAARWYLRRRARVT